MLLRLLNRFSAWYLQRHAEKIRELRFKYNDYNSQVKYLGDLRDRVYRDDWTPQERSAYMVRAYERIVQQQDEAVVQRELVAEQLKQIGVEP